MYYYVFIRYTIVYIICTLIIYLYYDIHNIEASRGAKCDNKRDRL